MVAIHGRIPSADGQSLCRAICLAVGVAALLTTGCKSTHQQMVDFLRAHEVEVSTGDYVVRPPDGISIYAPGSPEVDGAGQVVRPDGKVVLRLLGEVDVAGLTTDEIADKLKVLLARYYVEPEVVVQVTRYASQVYYVFGEVSSPGPRIYTGRDTVLTALAMSQPSFLAWKSRIRVVRPSAKEEERRMVIVNLHEMVKSGDTSKNFLLQPGDIIEVPPTPLAWVGLRIRELLYPVQPVLDAYTTPARVVSSNDVYEREFGAEEDNNQRDFRSFPFPR